MSWKPVLGSRAFWLRQMRQWHWISAAICLIGMLLFAVTGITLNHASQDRSQAGRRSERTRDLPPALLAAVEGARRRQARHALPPALRTGSRRRCRVADRRARSRMVGAGDLRRAAAARRRRVAEHRPRQRRGALRAHRPRLDFLSQRSAQGPQHRRGLVAVPRRVRGRLRRVLRHRAGAAATAVRRAAFDLAAGRARARSFRLLLAIFFIH